VVPHVGETDTDTLTEIPGRPAEAEEENEEEEEVEDEFGYNWSEFTFCKSKGAVIYSARYDSKNVHFVIFLSLVCLI